MRRLRCSKRVRVLLIGLTCWMPVQAAVAAAPEVRPAERPAATAAVDVIRDIELGANGRLSGQLLNAEGQPHAGQPILLHQQDGQLIGHTLTDAQGWFHFEHVRGGIYQLVSAEAFQLCRCWVQNTAPPAAEKQVLLVAGAIERGQRPFYQVLANPLFIGILIAAAIAIPIAVHNARDSGS